jgi:predicted enzyme involved in methoxymalonyl-ACP biosynthesis
MGREAEKAILYFIINEAKNSNIKILKAKFIPTEKNKPIENFLADCQFYKKDDIWIYNLNKPFNMPNFLTLSEE